MRPGPLTGRRALLFLASESRPLSPYDLGPPLLGTGGGGCGAFYWRQWGRGVSMSKHTKHGLAALGALVALLVGIVSLSQTVWASGGDYAVLASRVQRLERDMAADSERLRRIERRLIRMCAVTPGCE